MKGRCGTCGFVERNQDCGVCRSLPVDPLAGSDETRDAEIIVAYDGYRELQRETRIARHLRAVLPLIYAQMVKEIESGSWPD